eukprot:CAMPEP_0194487360 /NCGR_PEP_ID=MMETSP0253-20130528/7666_1 /TAXON_ID=2966 /ORGANISM="Noctiluca scintillans" /LENGTH=144 /DNA_ID=CAMNT_0039327567 /DNA_START=52 /DNA_END=486 /DNA_ORIENTATION=+
MSLFTRFVEPGRLALITYGPCAGKTCTIVDIVDQRRVVVDGPQDVTGVPRHMMPIRRLRLTDLKTKIPRKAIQKTLRKQLSEQGTMTKFTETKLARKMEAANASKWMTDFEKFKLMLVKKKRSRAVKDSKRKKTGEIRLALAKK